MICDSTIRDICIDMYYFKTIVCTFMYRSGFQVHSIATPNLKSSSAKESVLLTPNTNCLALYHCDKQANLLLSSF